MRTLSRREWAKAAAAAAALTASGARARPAPPAPPHDLSFIASELRPDAEKLLAMMASFPQLSASGLAVMRNASAAFGRSPLSAPRFEQRVVKGSAGAPDVTVYVINAEASANRPAILHTHGGGYVMGSARSNIGDLQTLAASVDCTIVTVEYRLAPETTFAGSIEDNYAALRWLHDNAAELGVDARRIAVMGESAGGGHAALLALAARDRGEVPLVYQVLIYPMLDDRTGLTRQPPGPIGTVLWTAKENRFGWRSFLGREPGGWGVPARAVPARYKSLAGLPPAFIGVGSVDLFVDEDVDYARRLIDSGVPTELVVVPGAFHGFDGIAPETEVAKSFTATKVAALRRAFAAVS